MAVNKVVFGNTTVMDITDSTVTASKLKSGETAYAANGAKITGELVVPEVLDDLSDVTINTPANAHEIYYNGSQWINYGAKILLTFDDAFQGQTITLSKGQTVITKVAPLTGNSMSLYISETGEWTISSTIDQETYETTVTVTAFGLTYEAELISIPPVPQGSTVTPTDDIQTWLACANIRDKSYTTLAEVLADRSTFETLIADSNACDYMARSTSWAGVTGGLVPAMTSATTPSGTVTSSANLSTDYGWKAFDGDDSTTSFCASAGQSANDYFLKYDFGEAVKINKIKVFEQPYNNTWEYAVMGSNDDSTYTQLCSITTPSGGTTSILTDEFAISNCEYRYYKLVIINGVSPHVSNVQSFRIYTLQFYYEGIATNQDAMALIGKYDYCSNALLGNATWASAIANSAYIESVLNTKVPTMTSNTTPSGVANASVNATNAWKVFDKNVTTYWNTSSLNNYVEYEFTTPIKLKVISFISDFSSASSYDRVKNFKVEAYNGNNWDVLITDTAEVTTSAVEQVFVCEGNNTYTRFRFYIIDSYAGNNIGLIELQFYGRKTNEVLVPLVPTMTSNTTPSGEVIEDNPNANVSYLGWKAFDNNSSTFFSPKNDGKTNEYIGYIFPSDVSISSISMNASDGVKSVTYDFTIQTYDGSNWTDSDSWEVTTTTTTQIFTKTVQLTNIRGIRLLSKDKSMSTSGDYYIRLYTLQFYQRAVQTNIIHSCANDTIYYMEDGSPVIVATTNSDGDGVLDFSSLDEGVYTFYSSVAKDPSNLSNDFSKTIRITKSEFGGTTEMYLLPDTVKTLYWWGYESSDLEDMSTANGWESYTSSFSWVAPTRSTNKINIYCSTSNKTCGIASKIKVPASSIKIIYQSVQTGAVSWYYVSTTTKAWNSETSQFGKTIPISSVMAFDNQATGASSDCYVGLATTTGKRSTDIYAFYYE